jgi:glutamyl-tRNA synthetase
MDISHVIRGDDHLSNTPRQVLLYRALGKRLPKFAHLPMILGDDRSRLSKRHGATSVQEYKRLGYTSDGLVNYLALLGWSLDGKTEFFTRRALIDKFSLKRVSRNPAAFDNGKLDHINAEHFQRLQPMAKVSLIYERLLSENILPPDFRVAGWSDPASIGNIDLTEISDETFRGEAPRLGVIINLMGNRLRSVADASARLAYFYKDDYPRNEAACRKHLEGENTVAGLTALADRLDGLEPFTRPEIETAVRDLAESTGLKAGELIHPCRVALTGDDVSPDIFGVIHLLGRSKCVQRLRAAVV